MNGTYTDGEHVIDMVSDILKIVAFILFGIAYALAFSYLNSLSLAKECLLVYLYKDVLSMMLSWRTFLAIEVMIDFWEVEGTSKTEALMISFGLQFGAMYSILILIFISIYNLHTAKTNTIDPTINWLGKDESSAIKRIRCGCSLSVIGFLAINFGLRLYPPILYAMMPHHSFGSALLISTIVYRGTVILLLLFCGIINVVRKIYGSTHETQIDRVLTMSIKYMFIIPAVIFITVTIAEACQFSDKRTSWENYQVVTSPIEIFAPFIIIFRSNQLKTHSIRLLKNKYNDLFMFNVYFVPAFMFIAINLSVYIIFKLVDD